MSKRYDSENDNNKVHVEGVLMEPLQFDHEILGEKFYSSKIRVKRLSGVVDHIRIMVSEALVNVDEINASEDLVFLKIDGSFRSFNSREKDAKQHLVLFVFVKKISVETSGTDDDPKQLLNRGSNNSIQLIGFLCKQPILRKKEQSGRVIADIMLAVNRSYGKCDYIPSIAWERQAMRVDRLKVGDKIMVTGRIQSRVYLKKLDDGTADEREAYEVSIHVLEIPEEDFIEETAGGVN